MKKKRVAKKAKAKVTVPGGVIAICGTQPMVSQLVGQILIGQLWQYVAREVKKGRDREDVLEEVRKDVKERLADVRKRLAKKKRK